MSKRRQEDDLMYDYTQEQELVQTKYARYDDTLPYAQISRNIMILDQKINTLGQMVDETLSMLKILAREQKMLNQRVNTLLINKNVLVEMRRGKDEDVSYIS